MSSTKTIRLASGGVLEVRQGILRGAGPAGPIGPVGDIGPQGSQGFQGPMGFVNDVAGLATMTTDVNITSAGAGTILTFQTCFEDPYGSPHSNPLVMSDGILFHVYGDGSYTGVITAIFASGSGATGRRRLGLYPDGSATPAFFVEVPANTAGETTVNVPIAAYFSSAQFWNVRAHTTGSADTVTSCTWHLVRNGLGEQGPEGPQGGIGPQGPQGYQGSFGPQGASGSGYGTFDALVTGSGSGAIPTGGEATADQGIPYPAHDQSPIIPGWLNRIVLALERLLVSRYVDAANRTSKRGTRAAGEVTFLTSDSSLWVRGDSADAALGQVQVSTTAPPPGTYPAGTIWIKI